MAKTQTKTKTTNKKSTYKTHEPKGYKIATLVLAFVSAGLLAGLIACATQMKSSEESEYLAFYPDLLRMYSNLRCAEQEGHVHSDPEKYPDAQNENYVCEKTDYGISKDGDPYVSMIQHIYDATTHEEIDTKKMTVYFQRPSSPDRSYSQAVSYDD